MRNRIAGYAMAWILALAGIICVFAWGIELGGNLASPIFLFMAVLSAERAFGISDLALSTMLTDTRGKLIDYAESGIPEQSATVIVVPILLHSMEQIRCVMDTVRWNILVANDTNVSLVLIADLPDALKEGETSEETRLIAAMRSSVDAVNDGLGSTYRNPVSVIYRPRVFVPQQGCWMGPERKLGKVELAVDLMLGIEREVRIYERSTLERLRAAKYMLILDEDSKLTPNTVHWLVGFLDHPSNHPRIDESGRLKGHGIAVCQSVIDPESATHWRLSRALVGQRINPAVTPPPAMSFHFEWFGQARFNGKGLIEPRTYRHLMQGKMPRNLVLSHDTVEAAYLKPGFVGVGGVTERFPGSHEALLARNIRWMRGDLQNAYLAFFGRSGQKPQADGFPVLGRVNIFQQIIHYLGNLAMFPFLLLVSAGGVSARHAITVIVLVGLGSYERLVVNALRDIKRQISSRQVWEIYPRYLVRLHVAIWHRIMLAPANFYGACVALARVSFGLSRKNGLLSWQTAAAADSRSSSSHLCATGSLLGLVGVGGVISLDRWSWGAVFLACTWAFLAVCDSVLVRKTSK